MKRTLQVAEDELAAGEVVAVVGDGLEDVVPAAVLRAHPPCSMKGSTSVFWPSIDPHIVQISGLFSRIIGDTKRAPFHCERMSRALSTTCFNALYVM